MLSNVLPGLRELRAPLAAGYLWLTWSWLVWGDDLPTRAEVSGPLARLYALEPVVSKLGVAVVASVGAYIVGSIAIDMQSRLGHPLAVHLYARFGFDLRTMVIRTLRLTRFGVSDAPGFSLTYAGERVLDLVAQRPG